MTRLRSLCLALASACVPVLPAVAQPTQGVSKNEIVIGTIQDLSGPIAAYGKAVNCKACHEVHKGKGPGGPGGSAGTLTSSELRTLIQSSLIVAG